MKGMILAAGLGERMRPLTNDTPKPLLMLAGKPLIVHTLLRCKAAGITDIVINLCYRAEQIQATLKDGSEWGMRIQYSLEEKPLGMAGGAIHALHLLGDAPFIMMSSDVVTDFSFASLVKKAPTVSHAHLVMVDNPPFHPKGDFHLNRRGIVSIEGEPKLNYAGFGIFHPLLFQGIPDAHMGMTSMLAPYLSVGEVTGEYFKGEWHNLGTPQQYTALCAHMAASS